MTDWKKAFEGQALIAHISDLHFGSAGQPPCWNDLVDFLKGEIDPKLILVTGDIVDSPGHGLYDQARESLDRLGIPYYVCAGNHDRHFKGNVARIVDYVGGLMRGHNTFDEIFGPKLTGRNTILGPEAVVTVQLGQWKVGLLGVDSSIEADYFARGYLQEEIFSQIEKATQRGDWDLLVLLVHHHVQPVRKLEERKHSNLTDLADVMSLVNSGTLLEVLTKARVDVLLHGHEHVPYWAKYGSLEGARREVCIIGAGSATGKDAAMGCSPNQASFNLIGLGGDRRSATFYVLDHHMDWQFSRDLPALDLSGVTGIRLLPQ